MFKISRQYFNKKMFDHFIDLSNKSILSKSILKKNKLNEEEIIRNQINEALFRRSMNLSNIPMKEFNKQKSTFMVGKVYK
jgi:hypothetical protein